MRIPYIVTIFFLLPGMAAFSLDEEWQVITPPPHIKIERAVSGDDANAMSFYSNQGYGCISHSPDGGHTWIRKYSDSSATWPAPGSIFAATIADMCHKDGTFFFLMDSGKIKYTSDYGETIDSIQMYTFRHEAQNLYSNDKYIVATFSVGFLYDNEKKGSYCKIIVSDDNFKTYRSLTILEDMQADYSLCRFELNGDFLYILRTVSFGDVGQRLTRVDLRNDTYQTWAFPYKYSVAMTRVIGQDSILAYYIDMDEYKQSPDPLPRYIMVIELDDNDDHRYGARQPYPFYLHGATRPLFEIGTRYYFSLMYFDKRTNELGQLMPYDQEGCKSKEFNNISYSAGRIFLPNTDGDCLLMNDNFTSVGNEDSGKYSNNIYPNPATNILNINADIPATAEIYFYNIMGEKVFPTRLENLSFDISYLPAGIYTLVINVVSDNKIMRFVKR